jgi:PKHD-type hydroxylase
VPSLIFRLAFDPVDMSELGLHPTSTFAAWTDAFTPAEMDRIEACGDRLAAEKATLFSGTVEGEVRGKIRVTQTAWLAPNAETKWIYDRVQGVARALNERVYQFDLRGFSENLQYSIYHGSEGGHYDWHVDQGQLKAPRKLSISLQLTEPSEYEGCDLQFQGGNRIETAPRERGTLIAFPSYVLHRVTPCTKGIRKAVVAWTTGPQFK